MFASRPGSFRVKVNRNLNCVHGTSYETLVRSSLASFDRVFALNAGGKYCSAKFTIETNFVIRGEGGGASFKNEQLAFPTFEIIVQVKVSFLIIMNLLFFFFLWECLWWLFVVRNISHQHFGIEELSRIKGWKFERDGNFI